VEKKEIIENILNGIIEFKIIPFFGAGMSKPCGAKDWNEIIDLLKIDLKTTSKNHLIIAQEYENKFGREKLISKIKSACELTKTNSNSLENHLKIISMNPPIIYTTNYDNAIEIASEQLNANYKKIVSLKDIVDSPHGQKQIIKFHGDFSNSESIVFTKSDYENRLQIDKHCLDVLFRSHILGKGILFLGYGFGDINIDYIFEKHTKLYGNSELPKSYIISFKKDSEQEQKLKEKNITTLFLNSPRELNELIGELNFNAFEKSFGLQVQDMFKPLPTVTLTNYELNNLKEFINLNQHSPKNKFDKIRETLEMKNLPLDVEEKLVELYTEIINGEYSDNIKEAFLISLNHLYFKKTDSLIKIFFELFNLFDNPRFILDFHKNNFTDVFMIIEKKVGDIFNDSIEARKFNCVLILGYLEGMISENKKLSFELLDRLLSVLKNQGYDEFKEFGYSYDITKANEIIEHYLKKNNSTLRARFKSKGIGNKRIPTLLEHKNQIMRNVPKNLK
jgi:hypothetical protein